MDTSALADTASAPVMTVTPTDTAKAK
jgi:hypothetical protein